MIYLCPSTIVEIVPSNGRTVIAFTSTPFSIQRIWAIPDNVYSFVYFPYAHSISPLILFSTIFVSFVPFVGGGGGGWSYDTVDSSSGITVEKNEYGLYEGGEGEPQYDLIILLRMRHKLPVWLWIMNLGPPWGGEYIEILDGFGVQSMQWTEYIPFDGGGVGNLDTVGWGWYGIYGECVDDTRGELVFSEWLS